MGVFFNDTETTEIYTRALHDALPIYELASANKRLKDAAAQLTKSSAAAKQKDEKIETLLSSKEDVEKQLTLVAEDLAIFKERYAAGERTKAQLEAHNADLQAQLRRSKSMHETQITQLQQRLSEIDSDREGLNNEQERLLEEVVSKQEEVDQMMAQVIKLQDSDEALEIGRASCRERV